MSIATVDSVKEGDEYSFSVEDFNRTQFVKYAGAGGDFNPIHHDEKFAEGAGLPEVFGMGLLTAGMLSRIPTEWFGPTAVQNFKVQFRQRLWPGATVTFTGKVTKTYEQDGVAHADLDLGAVNSKGEVLIIGSGTVRNWNP